MIKGSLYSFPSAPCKAENLSVSLECNSSIATVWWNTTGVDQLYTVSAVNITGGVVGCSTSESYCTFNQLDCGEKYTITVTGVTQACTSQPSTSVDLSTGKFNRGRQVRIKIETPVPTGERQNYLCSGNRQWYLLKGETVIPVYR